MKDTKIISICGIDGAGKTSIVEAMKEQDIFQNAHYLSLSKNPPCNRDIINRYCDREYSDSRDWIKGSFAETIGVGLAFDFLKHYKDNIESLLGHVDYIVTDRYFACFICYLESINSTFPIDSLFSIAKKPDLVIHPQVSVNVLSERHKTRGGEQDDEHPEVLLNFQNTYKKHFENVSYKVLTVNNDGLFSETMSIIKNQAPTLVG